MKLFKRLLLAAAVVPFLAVGTAAAQQSIAMTDSETPESTHTETTKPKTGNEGLSAEQRLEKYKTEAKTKLSNAEKTRIAGRCKASQVKVKVVQGRVAGFETHRGETYEKLLTRLTGLSEKLKAKGIDTTTYDAQVAELKAKVETYRTDLAKYHEAIDDLSAVDCAANTDGFKASLETARTLRAKVVADGQGIKSYLKDTLKPTLVALRTQVEQKKESN